jgi:hypothetical protein
VLACVVRMCVYVCMCMYVCMHVCVDELVDGGVILEGVCTYMHVIYALHACHAYMAY